MFKIIKWLLAIIASLIALYSTYLYIVSPEASESLWLFVAGAFLNAILLIASGVLIYWAKKN